MEHISHTIKRVLKKTFYHRKATELCVLCGTDTNIPINTFIEFRAHYVEGSGQLCEVCWNNVYKNVM